MSCAIGRSLLERRSPLRRRAILSLLPRGFERIVPPAFCAQTAPMPAIALTDSVPVRMSTQPGGTNLTCPCGVRVLIAAAPEERGSRAVTCDRPLRCGPLLPLRIDVSNPYSGEMANGMPGGGVIVDLRGIGGLCPLLPCSPDRPGGCGHPGRRRSTRAHPGAGDVGRGERPVAREPRGIARYRVRSARVLGHPSRSRAASRQRFATHARDVLGRRRAGGGSRWWGRAGAGGARSWKFAPSRVTRQPGRARQPRLLWARWRRGVVRERAARP